MRLFQYFTVLAFLFWFSSCKVFKSNLMLKTPNNYAYDKLADSLSQQDYKIEANDVVQVRIFSNNGFKIIDLSNNLNIGGINLDYTVQRDGYVKLPLVGKVKLSGLSVREVESYLEQIYVAYYVDPFVTAKVTNKRVIVFPGNSGKAQVVSLNNNNTTVFEALALTGGIAEDGKAYKVKLIRNDVTTGKSKVYLIDLSTIDGIAAGNTVVLANDIIYVEPRYRFARTLVGELAPVVALISSTFLIYSLIVTK